MHTPLVSIIIPCFNEEKFIEDVIQNILEQDFPLDEMEMIFLDGRSTDETANLIKKYINYTPPEDQEKLHIQLFENPYRYVPQAMNLGIEKSRGEIIIRLDAHAAYPKNYVRKLVEWQRKLEADNVGGIWTIRPRSFSLKARAIATTLSHPVAVGNALYRMGVSEPKEVDTVPFGCFPKSVFEKHGNYDLRLRRNQDIELNKRIRRGGGKIFLVPDVSCIYFARDTYSALWKNNFDNGKWVILTAWFTKTFDSLSIRHFVPLGFFGYLLCCLFILGKMWYSGGFLWGKLFLIPLCFYLLLILFFSIKMSWKEKDLRMIPFFLMSFLTLHISYGAGSIAGIFSLFKT